MRHPFAILFAISSLMVSCGKPTQETKPIRRDVTETVFSSGILEADNTYNLTAQSDGYLKKVYFKEGDLVKQGMVLAIVENRESKINTESANALYNIARSNVSPDAPGLMQAKNSMKIAKQKMEHDSLQERRYKRLLESNSVAKADYESALLAYQSSLSNYKIAVEGYNKIRQEAEQQLIINKASKEVNMEVLGKNRIRAVEDGKVYKKLKQQGDFVRKGDVIAQIGSADSIYAKVNVDESNIAKVSVGQGAVIQLNTMKSKVYRGTVTEIYPAFDDATQSFLCKIQFQDTLDFKLVNTQLQANIIVGRHINALLIPRNYLDYGGFVTVKRTKARVKVSTGFVSNEWVQVLSGIDDDMVLVTDNIAENKMTTSEVGSQFNR